MKQRSDLIKLYFSTVKVLAQRLTHISAVATVLLITKRERERDRQRDRDRETETVKGRQTKRQRRRQTNGQTKKKGRQRQRQKGTDTVTETERCRGNPASEIRSATPIHQSNRWRHDWTKDTISHTTAVKSQTSVFTPFKTFTLLLPLFVFCFLLATRVKTAKTSTNRSLSHPFQKGPRQTRPKRTRRKEKARRIKLPTK